MYEVYAVRYAHHHRMSGENFLGGDPHEAAMPLDFFVWAVVSENKSWVVDLGFTAEQAKKRKRDFLRSPGDGLRLIGIEPAKIDDVIVTHMHYDHVGNLDLFPNATFHIQDREMHFCTGRCMCHPLMNAPFEVEDVVGMVRRVYAGKVAFHDGTTEIAPGLTPAPYRGAYRWPAMRARDDATGMGRTRLRRRASLCAYGSRAAPSRSSTTSATCWQATRPCGSLPPRPRISSRAMIRW